MWPHIAEGFVIGISAGLGCLVTCVPLFLSVGAAGASESRGRGIRALIKLLAGRLVGYVCFGLALGVIGQALLPEGVNLVPFFGVAYLILAALLIMYGLGMTGNRSGLCAAMGLAGRKTHSPFFIGLLTGFSICPPFLAVAAEALIAKSVLASTLIYAVFFLGTSLYVLPFFLVPFASKTFLADSFKRVGQVAAFAMAIWFFISGINAFAPMPDTWEPPYPDEPDLAAVEPGADRFEFLKAPRRKWLAVGSPESAAPTKTGEPELLGTVYYSQDTFPEGKAPKGYAGPVPVIVSLDNSGRIRGLTIHDNLETGGYLAMLTPDFLKSLAGKRYTDSFEIGKDIDAITGATKTLEAFTASLRETVRDAVKTDPGLLPTGGSISSEIIIPLDSALATVVLLACAMIVYYWSWRIPGYAVLGITVFVLGFCYKSYLDLGSIMSALTAGIQLSTVKAGFITLIFVALVTSVILGRFYCGYLCPFGALSELVGRIPTPKIALGRREDEYFRSAKYFLLAVLIALYLFSHNMSIFLFEPFAVTFSAPGELSLMWRDGSLLVMFAALMILANLVVPRFWCRYLCPTGALLAILGLLRIRFGEKEVTACHRCHNQGFGRRHECYNCVPSQPGEEINET